MLYSYRFRQKMREQDSESDGLWTAPFSDLGTVWNKILRCWLVRDWFLENIQKVQVLIVSWTLPKVRENVCCTQQFAKVDSTTFLFAFPFWTVEVPLDFSWWIYLACMLCLSRASGWHLGKKFEGPDFRFGDPCPLRWPACRVAVCGHPSSRHRHHSQSS